MTARAKKAPPKSFESTGVANDTHARIFESMLLSPAFMDLSKNQRLLYVYMKAQYFGKRKPGEDFKEIGILQEPELFYFSKTTAESYSLYARGSHMQFYNDVKALETHGFIKTVSNGSSTKKKSIYKFVGDWKQWKDSS